MNMKRGITRLVFFVGKYAIKIPNVNNGMCNFLEGCLSNWKERKYYKQFINADYNGNMVEYAAPSLFCSWFGFIQLQKRCYPLLRDLTSDEKEFFKPLCGTDNKKENFGFLNGKLVCLDYN